MGINMGACGWNEGVIHINGWVSEQVRTANRALGGGRKWLSEFVFRSPLLMRI